MADIIAKNLTREQDIPTVAEFKQLGSIVSSDSITEDIIKDYMFNSVNLIDDLISGTLTDIGGYDGVLTHLGEISQGRLKRAIIEVAGRALNFYESSLEYSMTDQDGSNESTAKSFAAKIFTNQREMVTPNLMTLLNKTGIYQFIKNGVMPFSTKENYLNKDEIVQYLNQKINGLDGAIDLDPLYFKVVDGKIQIITSNLPDNLKFADGTEVPTQSTRAEDIISEEDVKLKGLINSLEQLLQEKLSTTDDTTTGDVVSSIQWLNGDIVIIMIDDTGNEEIYRITNKEEKLSAGEKGQLLVKRSQFLELLEANGVLFKNGAKSSASHNATFFNITQTLTDGTIENWIFDSNGLPDSVVRVKDLEDVKTEISGKINRDGDTMSGPLYGAGTLEPTSFQNRTQIATMILQATPVSQRTIVTNQDANITAQTVKRTEIFTLGTNFPSNLAYIQLGDKTNFVSPGGDKFSTDTANDLVSYNILIGGVQMDGVTGVANSYIKRSFTQSREQWGVEQTATINFFVYRADDTIEKGYTITLKGVVIDGKLNLGETAYLIVRPYNNQGKPQTETFDGSVLLNDTTTTFDNQNVRVYLEKSQYVNYDTTNVNVPTFKDGVIVADVNWDDKLNKEGPVDRTTTGPEGKIRVRQSGDNFEIKTYDLNDNELWDFRAGVTNTSDDPVSFFEIKQIGTQRRTTGNNQVVVYQQLNLPMKMGGDKKWLKSLK